MPLLEACGVVAGYGETEILHGVSITVDEGEVVTIIGPNGCGKSTLMKAIVGLVRVRNGSVSLPGPGNIKLTAGNDRADWAVLRPSDQQCVPLSEHTREPRDGCVRAARRVPGAH